MKLTNLLFLTVFTGNTALYAYTLQYCQEIPSALFIFIIIGTVANIVMLFVTLGFDIRVGNTGVFNRDFLVEKILLDWLGGIEINYNNKIESSLLQFFTRGNMGPDSTYKDMIKLATDPELGKVYSFIMERQQQPIHNSRRISVQPGAEGEEQSAAHSVAIRTEHTAMDVPGIIG